MDFKFLEDASNIKVLLQIKKKISFVIHAQNKTFAQTLNNVFNIPLSQLSSSCIKGELISIQIVEDVYLTDLED